MSGPPPRSRVLFLAGAATLFAAFYLLSCRAAPPSPATSNEPTLESVPVPDLSRADPMVREQLEAARARHEARLRNLASSQRDKADSFGRLGMQYHAYDLQAAAFACYRNATLLAPQEARWHYLLASLLQSEGRLDEAVESLGRARELSPDDPAVLLRLGQVELARGEPDEARRSLKHALDLEPECAGILYGLGETARREGDLELAVTLFERGLAVDPDAVQIHYPLGQVLRQLGRTEEAAPHLGAAARLEIDPRDWPPCADPVLAELRRLTTGPSALILRGIGAEAAGADSLGLEELREAVRLAPEDASARINLGAALQRQGDLQAALVELEAAMSLDPRNAALLFDTSRLLQRLGEEGRAFDLLEQAVALDPDFIEARLTLATALQRRGQNEAALAHYDRVLAVEPRNVPARLQRALALGALGRRGEGLESVAGVLDDLPGLDFGARFNTASALALLGDGERAHRLLTTLIDEAPDAVTAARLHVNLGILELDAGEPATATASFSRALELDPESGPARAGLERARQASSRVGR